MEKKPADLIVLVVDTRHSIGSLAIARIIETQVESRNIKTLQVEIGKFAEDEPWEAPMQLLSQKVVGVVMVVDGPDWTKDTVTKFLRMIAQKFRGTVLMVESRFAPKWDDSNLTPQTLESTDVPDGLKLEWVHLASELPDKSPNVLALFSLLESEVRRLHPRKV